MGLVEQLLGADWASDELLERDEWTYEADDCMTSAWAGAELAPCGGASGSVSVSVSGSVAAHASAPVSSPWWALAADEENVAVAALAGPMDAKDDVKVETHAALDADALLVETALAPAAMSPVPAGSKQSAAGARDVRGAFSLLLSDDSGSDSSARAGHPAAATDGSVTSTTSVASSPSSAQASPPPPGGKTEAKPAGKKPRRRAGSTGNSGGKPPADLAWDERDLTPLEIRRKRNRESMQRARRRQRDDIEQMKETLLELEQRYQALSEASLARRASVAAVSPVSPAGEALEADYYALADLSHVLKEEKFLLEQLLTDKQKTFRRFEQTMTDRQQELELPCPTTTSPTSLFSDFEFSPLTEHQVNEHIRNCYQHIRLVEETAKPFTSRPFAEIESGGKPARRHSTGGSPMGMFGGEDMEPGCPIPPSATFGWKVKCESTPSGDFFVSFSKFFLGVTAQEAMVNAWQRFSSPQSSPFRRVVRYEQLQVVNDSAYIGGIDIEHPVVPGKCMRAHNLFFRMQTEKGFVIGRYTVNPSVEVRAALEHDSPFEYVDSCNWVEFTTQHDDETGDEGVNVKFIASTEYNTQEDMYVRLVNSISRTMSWEHAVMPSPMTLLPS